MHPILIAEACQNHNGSRETLKKIIHEAAEKGADYVKIQALRSREITYRERFEEGITDPDGAIKAINRPYEAEVARLSKLDLSLDDEAWFVEECNRAGVASMTTAFTRTAVHDVKDMGYEAIKIASYDCASYPLLRDVRKWWSTIVVSTGATYDSEIEKAAEVLSGVNFAFLHCVTIYPTPINECHLQRMQWLRRFTPDVGWSDHSHIRRDGIWASKIALALGANIIERHFTILNEDETRDGPVSITPKLLHELREFADLSRQERMAIVRREYPDWEVALGMAQRQLSHEESLNRDYYRGRVAAKIGGRVVYNWDEEIDFDIMLAESGTA